MKAKPAHIHPVDAAPRLQADYAGALINRLETLHSFGIIKHEKPVRHAVLDERDKIEALLLRTEPQNDRHAFTLLLLALKQLEIVAFDHRCRFDDLKHDQNPVQTSPENFERDLEYLEAAQRGAVAVFHFILKTKALGNLPKFKLDTMLLDDLAVFSPANNL